MATTTKAKAKKSAPTIRLTLSTFDQSGRPVYRTLRERVKLAGFKDVTFEDYSPAGGTPLLDATFEFITHLRKLSKKDEVHVGLLLDESGSMAPNRQAVIGSVNEFVNGLREVQTVDAKNAGGGFLVICSDGYENASREHDYEDVRSLIAKCERAGWVLICLGAGIDAWAQGSKLGFSGGVTGQMVSTANTPQGTYAAMASVTSDGIGYLGDHGTYMKKRAGSSVRTLSEDGKETVLTPTSASVPPPAPPPAPVVAGWASGRTAYDSADAVRKAREKLSE